MDLQLDSVIELAQSLCELLVEAVCNFVRVIRSHPVETFIGALLSGTVVCAGLWQWHHSADFAVGELASRVTARNFQGLDTCLDIDKFSQSTAVQLYSSCRDERKMQVVARLFGLSYQPNSCADLGTAIKSRLQQISGPKAEPLKSPVSLRYQGQLEPPELFSCFRLKASRTMRFESPQGEVLVSVLLSKKSLADNFLVESLQSAPQLLDCLAAQELPPANYPSLRPFVGSAAVLKAKEKVGALKPVLRKLGSKWLE